MKLMADPIIEHGLAAPEITEVAVPPETRFGRRSLSRCARRGYRCVVAVDGHAPLLRVRARAGAPTPATVSGGRPRCREISIPATALKID